MVKIMEFILRVDKQGRIVIPRDVRRILGINEKTEIICRIVGEKIVLEKFSSDFIYRAFNDLEEIAPSLDFDSVSVELEDKYLDREYALRKIGL